MPRWARSRACGSPTTCAEPRGGRRDRRHTLARRYRRASAAPVPLRFSENAEPRPPALPPAGVGGDGMYTSRSEMTRSPLAQPLLPSREKGRPAGQDEGGHEHGASGPPHLRCRSRRFASASWRRTAAGGRLCPSPARGEGLDRGERVISERDVYMPCRQHQPGGTVERRALRRPLRRCRQPRPGPSADTETTFLWRIVPPACCPWVSCPGRGGSAAAA
jgi:hypothetical protein